MVVQEQLRQARLAHLHTDEEDDLDKVLILEVQRKENVDRSKEVLLNRHFDRVLLLLDQSRMENLQQDQEPFRLSRLVHHEFLAQASTVS